MAVKTTQRKKRDINIQRIRNEFPMLGKKVNRKPFIYFDNAATGHKPKSVMQRLQEFYTGEYGKPKERHELGKQSTEAVEEARKKIAEFIGAANEKTIVFTRGCTESINIVAGGFGKGILKKGDQVLISELEHHANIVPWQMACENSGAELKAIPIIPTGEIDMEAYEKMLNSKVKIMAISHSSHVLGTILPVKKMIAMAHKKGIPVLLDGAQAAPHMPINVEELDCDFYTFSGHKMGAPTGIGILYGKPRSLGMIPPFEGGSDMAKKVTLEKTEYAPLPGRLEAGTMPFADIIAFSELIDFLNKLDMQKMFQYEQQLLHYAEKEISNIATVSIVGTAPLKEAVIALNIDGADAKEVEKYLNDEHNIFVKGGDLNAQPLMKVLGVKGLLRISFSYYNTKDEIDILVKALKNFVGQS